MVKGVEDLNELDFDLMVRLIACGLYEKRQCNVAAVPIEVKHIGRAFRINMFIGEVI